MRHPPAAWLPLALGWTPYLPLGLQYLVFLGCGVAAGRRLAAQQGLGQAARHPLVLAAAALWLWLLVSAAWSRAPAAAIVSHLWMYALPLLAALIAFAVPAPTARRALTHFVVASTLVALAELVAAAGFWPAAAGARPIVDVLGNQRIAFSLLLALASALAAHAALQPASPRRRVLFALAAMICLAGVSWQDRRTGMLAAPLLLAVLALVRQRNTWRRMALLGLIALAALAIGLGSTNVRARFDEGIAELQAYRGSGEVTTSWGMRARMLETTGRLVLEAPFVGHGVGSWVTEWRARVAGSAALEAHTTPHSEYLLLAMQGGLVAAALALRLWLLALRGIRRRGAAAQPALLVLAAMTWAGLFNVVLRDAKFAVALLGLAALAWAAARAPATPAPPPPRRENRTPQRSRAALSGPPHRSDPPDPVR